MSWAGKFLPICIEDPCQELLDSQCSKEPAHKPRKQSQELGQPELRDAKAKPESAGPKLFLTRGRAAEGRGHLNAQEMRSCRCQGPVKGRLSEVRADSGDLLQLPSVPGSR